MLVLLRANPVYLRTGYAKQISNLNKIARGRVMSAQENRLLEGLGCFLFFTDWCRECMKALALEFPPLEQLGRVTVMA